jgi:hypothetical protein
MVNDLQGEPGTTSGKRTRKRKPHAPLSTLTQPRKGPPTVWTQAIEDHLVLQLANGIPLRVICREPGMPEFHTVYAWMERDPAFNRRIAHAREIGWESIAQECLEIAHDERHDWKLTLRGPVHDETHVQRAKLQIETRLKLLAKWFPKKYGDKLEVSGGLIFTPLSDLMAKAAEIRQREALAFGEVIDIPALPAGESAPESLPASGNQQHEGKPA